MKYSRSKMYAKRAQHKRTKTVTKVEAKKAPAVLNKQVKGDKNGGSRKVKFIFEKYNKWGDKSGPVLYPLFLPG